MGIDERLQGVNERSRLKTAINMMIVDHDLTVLWMDKELVVVDKILAKKWVPFYVSRYPAQYVVELHRSRFFLYSPGDRLVLIE